MKQVHESDWHGACRRQAQVHQRQAAAQAAQASIEGRQLATARDNAQAAQQQCQQVLSMSCQVLCVARNATVSGLTVRLCSSNSRWRS